jgi:hypothetical protein
MDVCEIGWESHSQVPVVPRQFDGVTCSGLANRDFDENISIDFVDVLRKALTRPEKERIKSFTVPAREVLILGVVHLLEGIFRREVLEMMPDFVMNGLPDLVLPVPVVGRPRKLQERPIIQNDPGTNLTRAAKISRIKVGEALPEGVDLAQRRVAYRFAGDVDAFDPVFIVVRDLREDLLGAGGEGREVDGLNRWTWDVGRGTSNNG